MKPTWILLTIAAAVGTSAARAQSITVSQPATAIAVSPRQSAQQPTQSIAIHHTLSPNLARVTGHRNADGTLSAQCTIVTNPAYLAARRTGAGTTTTKQHKK